MKIFENFGIWKLPSTPLSGDRRSNFLLCMFHYLIERSHFSFSSLRITSPLAPTPTAKQSRLTGKMCVLMWWTLLARRSTPPCAIRYTDPATDFSLYLQSPTANPCTPSRGSCMHPDRFHTSSNHMQSSFQFDRFLFMTKILRTGWIGLSCCLVLSFYFWVPEFRHC